MFQNMLRFNRFSSKIILAFLLLILIPTLFVSVSVYWVSNSILKKNVRESTYQITKQTADSISSILNIGVDTSDFITSDLTIQRAALQLNSNPSFEDSNYINTLLNNVVYSNSFVKIVYIFKEESNGWGSGAFSKAIFRNIRVSDQEWVKEAERKDGELIWQGLEYDRFSGGGNSTDLVLPLGRVLKDFDTMNNIGYVQVLLDGEAILGTIENLRLGETGKFFVVNPEGKIMIDSDLGRINRNAENPDLYKHIMDNGSMEFEFAVDGIPHYGVKQLLSNGWMLVGTVPVHEISGQMDRLQTWILFSFAVFSLLAIIIGLVIAGRVTDPVKQLTRSMQLVQKGDLKVRADVHSSDEIGFLGTQFNHMLQEIEQLMQQVKSEQTEKHHAELRAVIHRIHPHFLYNTLSTLRWLIDANKNDRASQVLSALTHLLEANMGKKGNMLTVKEELDIIRKYLAILEFRYEKTFHLELDVDRGADKLLIPRMLLQPVVENAIFHGIVPKNTNGRIWILIRFLGEDLEFTVLDDGLGIEEWKLKLLNDPEAAAAKGEMGIGLRHVYDTLRFYFPGSWECSIGRGPDGQGTSIRILLKNIVRQQQRLSETGEHNV